MITEPMLEVARCIYEAARLEAQRSKRRVVPEPWPLRPEWFREQFVELVQDYMGRDRLPTPEEAHNSWMEAYSTAGWKFGPERSVALRTHPDLVAYDQLPPSERDKDAIFLALVWLAKNIMRQLRARADPAEQPADERTRGG